MERNVARFISGPDLPRGFDRFVADASAAEAGGHNQSVRLLVASWLAAERLWGGADGSLHRLRSAHA